jgi:ADP-heptose:LPS heptosyltransferase
MSGDPFFKRVEIGFRRILIQSVGRLRKQRTLPPADIEFNRCKFLFVRQDRIGDVLVSTPLFFLLKKMYPDGVIDVLLSSNNHFVLQNDPSIRKRWMYSKRLFSTIALIRAIRRERYDFVIDLMDNPSATSTLFSVLFNGRWNVGLEKENAFVYDIVCPLLSRADTHITDRLAQLLTAFRINPADHKLTTHYYVDANNARWAKEALNSHRNNHQMIIGINISAGGEARYWGVENYRALLAWMDDHHPESVALLLYHVSDKPIAETVAKGFDRCVLSPSTPTFDKFAALISELDLLMTPDTSAVHLASAFSIPSVVMYVQSNKSLRIWEPYHTPCKALVSDVDDLKTIIVASVSSAIDEMLCLGKDLKERRKP